MAASLEGNMPEVAPTLGNTSFGAQFSPITAADFLPPRTFPGRKWDRIAVPAATRRYKIRKRVDGGVIPDQDQHMAAMAELGKQGQGARKRARVAEHVPVGGEGEFCPAYPVRTCGDAENGWLVGEEALAQAMVLATQDRPDFVDASRMTSRSATFPEEKLKWVPRKRNSSRWPVDAGCKRPSQKTPLTTNEQSSLDTAIPEAPAEEVQETAQQADEKQMRRRSVRRMSRRVSFAPLDDTFMLHSPLAIRSPVKADVATTPKRKSPAKVATSPQKSFTLQATPARVLFGSPALRSLSPSIFKTRASLQVTPRKPVIEVEENKADKSTPSLTGSPHLVFDQPLPDVQVEPEHETSRRASLHNARRRERRSSGGLARLTRFEGAQRSVPNRRHSAFPAQDVEPAGNKGRRQTLHVFSGNGLQLVEEEDMVTSGCSSAETTVALSEVVVDVGANLDIFGAAAVTRRKKHHRASVQRDLQVGEAEAPASLDTQIDEMSPEAHELEQSFQQDPETESDIPRGVDHLTEDNMAEDDRLKQGATPDAAMKSDDKDDDSTDTVIHTVQEYEEEEEEEAQEDMFIPQDPEGLSTIFEESEMMSPKKQIVLKSSAMIISPPFEGAVVAPDSQEEKRETPEDDMQEITESEMEVDGRDDMLADSEATQDGVDQEKVPLEAVSGEEDALEPVEDATSPDSASDGSQEDERPSQTPSEDDGSVNMAEDDFCGLIALEDAPAEDDKDMTDDDEEADDENQRDETLAVSWNEVASPFSVHVVENKILSSTPPQSIKFSADAVKDDEAGNESVPETPPREDSTPAHTEAALQSPEVPITQKEAADDDRDSAEDEDEEDADDDMGLALDYEPTVPLQLSDTTETGPENAPEPDVTAAEPEAQEDSETEMLRKFVTRVRANKNAKAAATAAALESSRSLRPKRKSGSTGSTTAISATGSPADKSSEPQAEQPSTFKPNPRLPLGTKDANSPSPTKKRKAYTPDDLFKGNPDMFSAEISPPKSKRPRRKRALNGKAETSLHDNTVNTAPPVQQEEPSQHATEDIGTQGAPPRRSTRSRIGRVTLKPAAPSANSIAYSVRLSGAQSMPDMDGAMPMPIVVTRSTRTTAQEKDLAAVTRVNTRKNKGTSVYPRVFLSRQAEDPAGLKMKELKSVFDAKEERAASVAAGSSEDGSGEGSKKKDERKGRKGKGVRWAIELARYQSVEGKEEEEVVAAAPATTNKTAKVTPIPLPWHPSSLEAKDAKPFPTAVVEDAEAVVETNKSEKKKKEDKSAAAPAPAPAPAPVRRTRLASRLQPPTPIDKTILTSKSSVPVPEPKVALSTPATKMVTRRTRIGTLGMGVNGTPAPKRRGRGAV